MKTHIKIILALILILLIIQIPIFRPEKNYSPARPDEDIAIKYEVPMDVLMHLNNACYDCHSNYTEEYPWYFNIQPVSWWMNLHIQRARDTLNFSEFAAYPSEKAADAFQEIQNVMEDHSMPLKSYLWLHDEAKLNDKEYKDVAVWAEKMRAEIEEFLEKN